MSFWNWLKSLFSSEEPVKKIELPPEATEPLWLTIARAEVGEKEIRGGENPRIIEYHSKTTGKFKEDEIPWCSSFVCWCLWKANYRHTANALAVSYRTYGKSIASIFDAAPGDVVVRSRGKDARGNTLHHVHFLEATPKKSATKYSAIGGNQSDAVTIQLASVDGILSIRRPVR